ARTDSGHHFHSFEQSFPAAAFSNCKITDFSPAILFGTNTCKFSSPGISDFTFTYSFVFRAFRSSRTGADNVNSAALSLHNHDSMHILKAGEYLISSDAVLSSALARMQLFRRPESKNIPVDFSSIPAISLKEK
uniref:Uncharacterized protein n=1 Tax=Crocodylus porosus TaxID=8502 RepID=A0A7M4FKU0_CROPO